MHIFVFLNNEDRYRYEKEEVYQISNEGKFNPPNTATYVLVHTRTVRKFYGWIQYDR